MDLKMDFQLPQETAFDAAQSKETVFDVAILGGGPAGLSAAVYTSRKQLSTVLISPDLGGQVLTTSGVENYMGFHYVTGPELAAKFSEQINQFPIKLILGERAASVSQAEDGLFQVETDGEKKIRCRALILATGKRSRTLNVPGEDHYRGRGVSYCSICDGPFFKGKAVLIAGGGNSAVTSAIDMLDLHSPVTLVNYARGWQADEVLLGQVKGRAGMLDGHKVLEIVGDGTKVTGARIAAVDGGPEKSVEVEGVFIEIGLSPNTEVFREFVELNTQGEVITSCASATSRPGVFAAGDCTTVPEKQIVIAAGEGAKAALAAYRFVKKIPMAQTAT